MSKRKPHRQQVELPFGDLPLHGEADSVDEPAEPILDARPVAADAAPAEPPPLFTDDDLRPVGPGTDDQDDAPTESLDELPALLQDRLLGGLADLTLHLAVIGLAIVATQLIGVPIRWGDWPPFLGLGLAFSFLYTVIPLAFWGHTPGMAWVGHSARSLSDEPLSFGQTLLRWIGSLLTVGLCGLPLLLAFSGRSLSDRLSDSQTFQI